MKPSEPHPLILLADDDEQTAAAWTAVLRLNGFDVCGGRLDGDFGLGSRAYRSPGPFAHRLEHAWV